MRARLTVVLLAIALAFAPLQAGWTPQHQGLMNPLHDIEFAPGSATVGYACGASNVMLNTTNGGADGWPQLNNLQQVGNLYDMCLPVDQNFIWIASDTGRAVFSPNAGASWQVTNTGVSTSLYGVSFPGQKDTGYVVGEGGVIRKTTNTGRNWTDASSSVSVNLNAVQFVNTSEGWAVGDAGTIIHTTNGGQAWNTQSSPVNRDLFGLRFLNATDGWALGAGRACLRTTNGGQSWDSLASLPCQPTVDLHSVVFPVGPDTGYICGTAGTVMKTGNGGGTWGLLENLVDDLYAVEFVDNQTGWVCGGRVSIFATTDGGYVGVEETDPGPGSETRALTCGPNPLRSHTVIRLARPLDNNATLRVYDCAGGLVRTLDTRRSGLSPLVWDGRNDLNQKVSPGVYLIELNTKEGASQHAKVAVLR